MIVVSNSSPLIGLSAIDLLDVMHTLYTTIHIPEAVYQEVVIKGTGRTGARQVAAAPWIIRHTISDQQAVQDIRKKTKLQQGESETIVLASELSAGLIILDDQAARQYALQEQLPVTGTAGVLLAARRGGHIPSVKQPMDALIAFGIRISPHVYQAILKQAGE